MLKMAGQKGQKMRKLWNKIGVEFETEYAYRAWNQLAVGAGAVLAGVLFGISWHWAIIPGTLIATAGAWLLFASVRMIMNA